jgi:predicted transcriptional regulator
LSIAGERRAPAAKPDDELRQTVAAVQEGVADAEAGRMRPLREIIDEARGKRPVGGE